MSIKAPLVKEKERRMPQIMPVETASRNKMKLSIFIKRQIHHVKTEKRLIFAMIFIAVLTFFLYFQMSNHDFQIIDDAVYVTHNPHVISGLTIENIFWAFTSLEAEFWHPITWLSYMIDTEFFGVTPGGYLLTNLLLHIVNTLILFYLIKTTTGKVWEGFIIALLFAIHPMHVEVVAWISERKELLCTFFWLCSTMAYCQYVISRIPTNRHHIIQHQCMSKNNRHNNYPDRLSPKNKSIFLYWFSLILFIMGLMSKSMIITLPFTFLLLDLWPLRRDETWRHLCIEKIPFFVITLLGCLITLFAQNRAGGVISIEKHPFSARLLNVATSYATYFKKSIYPGDLNIFYPIQPISNTCFFLSLVTLLLISFTVIFLFLKYNIRFPFTGWFWFIGTLVPVIGIVKIGEFAMTDRYSYIPFIGLFIIYIFGFHSILSSQKVSTTPRLKTTLQFIFTVTIIFVYMPQTTFQISLWKNSETLLINSLIISPNNFLSHHALGEMYAHQGKMDKAIIHFYRSATLRPDKAALWVKLGRALAAQKTTSWTQIETIFEKSETLNHEHPKPQFYLLITKLLQNQIFEAMEHFFLLSDRHPILKKDLKIKKLKKTLRDYQASKPTKPNQSSTQSKDDIFQKKMRLERDLSNVLNRYGFTNSEDALRSLLVQGYDAWDNQTL